MESWKEGGARRKGGSEVWWAGLATGHQLLATAVRPTHILSAGCGIQETKVIKNSEEDLVLNKEFPGVVLLQDSLYTPLAFGSILTEFWILSIASALQNRPVPLPLGPVGSPREGGGRNSVSCSA